MVTTNYKTLPLVYSCSGCSDIAQLANQVAIEFDRESFAEMSCIAGVGGDVPAIVKKAKSGRTIIALDGCPSHCVKHCLANQGVEATHHFILTDFDIKKRQHVDFSPTDVIKVKKRVLAAIK